MGSLSAAFGALQGHIGVTLGSYWDTLASIWVLKLGARVWGYSLRPVKGLNLYSEVRKDSINNKFWDNYTEQNNDIKTIFHNHAGGELSDIGYKNNFYAKNLVIDNLISPQIDGLIFFGGANFFQSNVTLDNITFLNSQSEDALNLKV